MGPFKPLLLTLRVTRKTQVAKEPATVEWRRESSGEKTVKMGLAASKILCCVVHSLVTLFLSSSAMEAFTTNVSFTLDGKAKPDHTVSILTGMCCMKLALTRAMLQQARWMALETSLPQTRPRSGS
jgi:hypothetical protein